MKHLPAVAAEIRKLFTAGDGFVIAGHQNPDGDALGACFALGLGLEKLGKEVKVLLEPFAEKFNCIPGQHLLYKGSFSTLAPNVFICLDCGDETRLPKDVLPLMKKAPCTVCIDHHETNTGYAHYNLIDETAAATCEMVFHVLETLVELDVSIASALYAGVVHDTGGFRHNLGRGDALLTASRLLQWAIPSTDIYSELMQQRSLAEARILSCTVNACRFRRDGRIAYACVDRALKDEASASSQDLDGVVDFLLNIRGVEIAALFYERTGTEVKASFRSRAVNVSPLATSFGGGGHALAAGCSLYGDIYEISEQVLAKVEQALDGYA